MREPSKPSSIIREEEDLTSRTLGRKHGYTSTSAINNSSSIDRRRNFAQEREGSYDPTLLKRNNNSNIAEDDRFLKVPGAISSNTSGKYTTLDTRYSPEKISYSPQKYDEYDGYANSTMPKREKLSKGITK